jgi:hypothetical protein
VQTSRGLLLLLLLLVVLLVVLRVLLLLVCKLPLVALQNAAYFSRQSIYQIPNP